MAAAPPSEAENADPVVSIIARHGRSVVIVSITADRSPVRSIFKRVTAVWDRTGCTGVVGGCDDNPALANSVASQSSVLSNDRPEP